MVLSSTIAFRDEIAGSDASIPVRVTDQPAVGGPFV